MQVYVTPRFKQSYKRLIQANVAAVDKALRLLGQNPWHPSLQTGKLSPKSKGIWYCRATRSVRITFKWANDVITLLDVGPHDILN
jgi:mRNA-degrading endonuclease YafQ of YafQ-DinJ toxin-antitoxin module